MTEEEKWARIQELQGVIGKAEAELRDLMEPKKGFLEQLQESLEAFDRERDGGLDYASKATEMCELLVAGLNMVNETMEGAVILRNDAFAVATSAGLIQYDTDDMEWRFTGGA